MLLSQATLAFLLVPLLAALALGMVFLGAATLLPMVRRDARVRGNPRRPQSAADPLRQAAHPRPAVTTLSGMVAVRLVTHDDIIACRRPWFPACE